MNDLLQAAELLCRNGEPPIFGFGADQYCKEIYWAHLPHLAQHNPQALDSLRQMQFWITGLPDALSEQSVIAAGGILRSSDEENPELWRVKKNFKNPVRRRLTIEVDGALFDKKRPDINGFSQEQQKHMQREAFKFAVACSGCPANLVVDSGGKSVHLVFELMDDDETIKAFRSQQSPLYKQIVQFLYLTFGDVDLGVANKSGREVFTRNPGGFRYDNGQQVAKQEIVSLNPNPVTLLDLLNWMRAQFAPETLERIDSSPVTTISQIKKLRNGSKVAGLYGVNLNNWRYTILSQDVGPGTRGTYVHKVGQELMRGGYVRPQFFRSPWEAPPIGQWQGSFFWWFSACIMHMVTDGWFFSQDPNNWDGGSSGGGSERTRWDEGDEYIVDKRDDDVEYWEMFGVPPEHAAEYREWIDVRGRLINQMVGTLEAKYVTLDQQSDVDVDAAQFYGASVMSKTDVKDMTNGEQLKGSLATEVLHTRPTVVKDRDNKSTGVLMLDPTKVSGGGGGGGKPDLDYVALAEALYTVLCTGGHTLIYLAGDLHKAVKDEDSWRYWTGTHWKQISTETIEFMFRNSVLNNSKINNVKEVISALKNLRQVFFTAEWEPNPDALSFTNGTVYLKSDGTWEFKPFHNPEDKLTKCLEREWVEPGTFDIRTCAPMWCRCMNDRFRDPTDQDAIATAMGAALVRRKVFKNVLALVGAGDSAKSAQIDDFIELVGGHQYTKATSFESLGGSGTRFGVEPLIDKDLIYCQEADFEAGYKRNSGVSMSKVWTVIKAISSPNDTVDTDRKNNSAVDVKLHGFGVLAMNGYPKIEDSSDAVYNRMVFVEMEPIPKDQQFTYTDIRSAFAREISYITAYCYGRMAHYVSTTKEIPRSERGQEIIHDLKQDNNDLYRWFCECTEPAPADQPDHGITVSRLADEYNAWAHQEDGHGNQYARTMSLREIMRTIGQMPSVHGSRVNVKRRGYQNWLPQMILCTEREDKENWWAPSASGMVARHIRGVRLVRSHMQDTPANQQQAKIIKMPQRQA